MSASPDFSKVQQRLRDQNIRVLVWGPGPGQPEYEKREKIRDLIKAELTSEAYFSEELMGKVPRAKYRSPREEQLWHLDWCTMCIVLDTSTTTAAEVAFCGNTNFGKKLFILIHQDNPNVSTYAAVFREHLHQYICNDDEWQIDNLAQLALAWAENVAFGKMAGIPV
jgi:hypothetical protein